MTKLAEFKFEFSNREKERFWSTSPGHGGGGGGGGGGGEGEREVDPVPKISPTSKKHHKPMFFALISWKPVFLKMWTESGPKTTAKPEFLNSRTDNRQPLQNKWC